MLRNVMKNALERIKMVIIWEMLFLAHSIKICVFLTEDRNYKTYINQKNKKINGWIQCQECKKFPHEASQGSLTNIYVNQFSHH